MKKLFYFTIFSLILIINACGGDNKHNIKSFADKFAGYVNAGQIDSIKIVYPSVNFDSITPFPTDSFQITETNGIYKVEFEKGKWIEVKTENNGNLIVENSKGIAAFPTDKYEIAIKTGMLNDSIADVRAWELLNDSTYFSWLKDNLQKKFQEELIITVVNKPGRMLGEGNYEINHIITVKNNTDYDLSGKDYEITSKGEGNNDSGIGGTFKINKGIPGIDVKAGQTATKSSSSRGSTHLKNAKAILKIPINEYINNYYKPNGNEYQQYLDSKK